MAYKEDAGNDPGLPNGRVVGDLVPVLNLRAYVKLPMCHVRIMGSPR